MLLRVDIGHKTVPVAGRIACGRNGHEYRRICLVRIRRGGENPTPVKRVVRNAGIVHVVGPQARPEAVHVYGAEYGAGPVLDADLGIQRRHDVVRANSSHGVRRYGRVVISERLKTLDGKR